ncbi:MAG: cellulase family glycosylhydrolase, partial [Planctomycetes bacterium]|nr:cellulase family glycosylhydrolase [Planctomycetota bacterium]
RTDRIMNQIDAHGLNVIVRLGVQPQWAGGGYPEVGPPNNLQDFADFTRAVATRYKDRIDAYQIWNEPNLSREWGNRPPSAAEYTAMLRVTYEAIKAADPYPVIISAGMAQTTRNDHAAHPPVYYIQEMYDAGAAPYFDALGVHALGYASPPGMDPAVIARTPGLANPDDFKPENNVPEELRRVYGFRHVEDVREIMVANDDANKQIVLLEFGWTIDSRPNSPYAWHAVTPEQQDQYFLCAYGYAKEHWQPWIGIMSLIYIADPQWTMNDDETYWSIVYPTYPEFTPAPAYFGLQSMPKDSTTIESNCPQSSENGSKLFLPVVLREVR